MMCAPSEGVLNNRILLDISYKPYITISPRNGIKGPNF